MNTIKKFVDIFIKEKKVFLNLKVKVGAGKTQIVEITEDNVIKITVKAVPDKGKANLEIIKFLCKVFKTDKENVKIISGNKSRRKTILLKL